MPIVGSFERMMLLQYTTKASPNPWFCWLQGGYRITLFPLPTGPVFLTLTSDTMVRLSKIIPLSSRRQQGTKCAHFFRQEYSSESFLDSKQNPAFLDSAHILLKVYVFCGLQGVIRSRICPERAQNMGRIYRMCPKYGQNPAFLDSAHILLKPYIFCASHRTFQTLTP